MERVWDRHEILAEVRRRGSTLRGIARSAGLSPTACSAALIRQLPSGERALAAFLGVPAATLFAYRRTYNRSTSQTEDSARSGESSGLKSWRFQTAEPGR